MVPTFIGIGPGRSGTSFIYEALLEHPQVTMAHGTKETNFFGSEYHRGIDWYASFFEGADTPAVGEISNNYFYDGDVAERMAAVVPEARLFSCLRHPFDRLRSVYQYRLRAGTIPASVPLDEAVERYPDLVEDNCYASRLAPFRAHFSPEQLLVLFYDDLDRDPRAFLTRLFAFVGVDPAFEPSVLDQRVNAAVELRSPWLQRVVGPAARLLRALGLVRVVTRLKRSDALRKALFRPPKSTGAAEALRLQPRTVERLRAAWEPEIAQLEADYGVSLAHWRDVPSTMLG